MRLLVASSWFPYPPMNGAKLRAFHLVEELGRRHDLTLLSFAECGEASQASMEALEGICRRVVAVRGNPHKPLGRLSVTDFFTRLPRSYEQTYSVEMAALLAGERGNHDAVVGMEIGTALYLPRFLGWPRIFEQAEVGQVFDQIARSGPWLVRTRHALTRLKYGAFTRHLVQGCSRTTVVSDFERQRLGDTGCDLSRVTVVPNGVDARYLDVRVPRSADRLVYSGALTFTANLDAVRYFLGHVLPEVRRVRPAVTLHVTGGHAGVHLESLPNRDHLVLTGHLEDVQGFVAASSVCVVPLRLGGGTRLKILEAMALGTPVVSTTKGAEGLDVVHGRHLLIADRPEDFAQAVVAILDSPGLATTLAENARQLVTERYTWSRIGGLLDEVVREAVEEERYQARRG